MARGVAHALRRDAALAGAAALLAVVLVAAIDPRAALAGLGGAIRPDAACADEADFKSLRGDDEAALSVINNTDEVVKTWWLDYDGERVFYANVAPHTSYIQETWLTHPWIVSSVDGDCYRFLVMTSLQQSVTVAPEIPNPAATVVPVSAAPQTARPVTGAPPIATAPSATGVSSGPTTPATSTDFLPLLIMGVLASIFVVVGGLAATGRLPGMRGRGRRP